MNTNPILDIETQLAWLEKQKTSMDSMHWLIEVDNRPAGVVNLSNIDWERKKTSSGLYIGEPSLRSFQLSTIVHMNMCDFIFCDLCLDELYVSVFSMNSGVVKLDLIWGFKIVKEVKNEIFKEGKYYDVTHLNITKYEWLQFKKNKHYPKIEFINKLNYI